MKKAISLLTSLLLLLSGFCGCTNTPAPDVTTDFPQTSEQTESAPATTSPITEPLPSEPDTAVLSLLDALNAVTENSYAEAKTNAYLESDARTDAELSRATTGQARYDKAQYPRLKQLSDGSYLLFWQYGTYGQHIYYAKSKNLIDWEAPKVLYNSANYKYKDEKGTEQRTYFVNLDACVLRSGDILTVVSFRQNSDYLNYPERAGIYLRRSSDNGNSWSAPQQIYTGVNWEPSIIELSTGEIQVYFTQVSPGIVYWGKNPDRNSTGTAMLRSTDGGKTWSPEVTESPWQAQLVFQQYIMQTENGSPSFTDQMSVPVELYDGTLAVACESKQTDKSFRISLIYSDPAWSDTPALDREGPADRQNNLYSGAGPYLVKMPSGETVLSYGSGSREMLLRVGQGDARTFGPEQSIFSAPGYWGSLEVTGANRLTAVYPVSSSANQILIKNLYLNHAIRAKNAEIKIDGKNSNDWKDITDALFCGSESQAQVVLRTAYKNGKLYLLAERRDDSLTELDETNLYLANAAGDSYRFTIHADGSVTATRGAGSSHLDTGNTPLFASSRVEENGREIGMITEIEVDLAALGLSGRRALMMTVGLFNADTDGSAAKDLIDGTDLTDARTWLPVSLAGEENGTEALASGEPATIEAGTVPENASFVMTFDRAERIESSVTGLNGTKVSLDAAAKCLSLRILDPYDPYASVVFESLDADRNKYMLIRYRVTENSGGSSMLGLYFCAGGMEPFAYTAQAHTGPELNRDGKWHTMLVDLSDASFYQGTLKTLRIDPFDGSNANPDDGIDLAWIAFYSDRISAVKDAD